MMLDFAKDDMQGGDLTPAYPQTENDAFSPQDDSDSEVYEFKTKINLEHPAQIQVEMNEEDEHLIDEYDAMDLDIDDDDEPETALSVAQGEFLEKKTLLQVDSKDLNEEKFRQAYLKKQVAARSLAERKAERQQHLAQYAEDVKNDPKKNIIFKFVKQNYIS